MRAPVAAPSARAAAVLGAVLALGLSAGCGTATTPAGAPVRVTGETAGSPAPDASSTAAASAAVELVRDWLGDLAAGDVAAAERVLGEFSRQGAQAYGGLQDMASGLAEGMAAFGGEGTSWDAVPVPGRDGAYLVTAAGEVTREGMTEAAARAWLVHPEAGHDVVEAFSATAPEVVVPRAGERLPADVPVEAVLPAGAPVVVVDGEVVTAGVSTQGAGADRVRVRVLPDGGWSPGRHVVTVATVPEPGAPAPWVATATLVDVG